MADKSTKDTKPAEGQLIYWFIIGRDFGKNNSFKYPVKDLQEAILVDNVVTHIGLMDILGIEDSAGDLNVIEGGEECSWYDEDGRDFTEYREEARPDLFGMCPFLPRDTEKIVKAFIAYLDPNKEHALNYRFFMKDVERKLTPFVPKQSEAT